MFLKELQEIGMSKNEAKVYETILDLGDCGVSDIANRSGIHRRSVYDTIERLQEKGMVFAIFTGKENQYSAAEPKVIYEMINEKQKTFKKILPYLENMNRGKPQSQKAFIYKGVEGYKNYVRDMSRVGEDCFFLGAKGNWLTPGIPIEIEKDFQNTMQRNGKKVQIIFDPRIKQREDIQKTASGEFKFLPEGFETPGVVDVFGDYVVTFNSAGIGNFGEKGVIFVMINKELAESYRTWFKFIWDRCEKA